MLYVLCYIYGNMALVEKKLEVEKEKVNNVFT